MAVTIQQVGWGSYLQYEGALWYGQQKFSLASVTPTWGAKVIAVITATEGGAFDAYNGYDRCIASAGLLQFCEYGQFSLSDMLGVVWSSAPYSIGPLENWLNSIGVQFRTNANGRFRFFFKDSRGEVTRGDEQNQLFRLNSSGLRGEWDDASKEYAKGWAAAIANLFADPTAQQAQLTFCGDRLMGFVTPQAKTLLFGPGTPSSNDGWVGAIRAGYLSFAANLPAVASKHALLAASASKAEPFSSDWCIELFKELTFGPQIAIYPGRYNKIRPVLENVFKVDLPDFATDLAAWTEKVLPPAPTNVPTFDSVKDYQNELIAEGFDIGPRGADGTLGPKTKEAIIQFQQLHGLTTDGIVGPLTRQAFVDAAKRRLGA
jgi:hypothetical protein